MQFTVSQSQYSVKAFLNFKYLAWEATVGNLTLLQTSHCMLAGSCAATPLYLESCRAKKKKKISTVQNLCQSSKKQFLLSESDFFQLWVHMGPRPSVKRPS